MKKKINVLIADDSVIFSQGLAILLEQNPNEVKETTVVHNYKSTMEVLAVKQVDVLILDLNFETEDFNGFTIAKKVKELYPKIKILILTQQAKVENYEVLFNEINVDGYLDKQLGVEDTFKSLKAVVRGEKYIDKNIKAMLEIGKWMEISKREKDVIDLLLQGFTQKEIAEKLFISARTVETHIKNLCLKLEAKNTTHLVSIYINYKKANREN